MYVNPFNSGLQVEQKIPFLFSSGVVALQPVLAGAILDRAWVEIVVPFDGIGASMEMGTTGLPALVFAPGEVTLSVAAEYGFKSVVEFPANDTLNLNVVSGGSTQGSGTLVFRYRGPA